MFNSVYCRILQKEYFVERESCKRTKLVQGRFGKELAFFYLTLVNNIDSCYSWSKGSFIFTAMSANTILFIRGLRAVCMACCFCASSSIYVLQHREKKFTEKCSGSEMLFCETGMANSMSV